MTATHGGRVIFPQVLRDAPGEITPELTRELAGAIVRAALGDG
ncbi:hypothetical protein [Plantactinospora sp. DSM 117369]